MADRTHLLTMGMLCLLFASTVLTLGSSATTGAVGDDEIITKNITSSDGIEFDVRIYLENLSFQVRINNPTQSTQNTGIVFRVDEWGRRTIDVEIEPGERIKRKTNFRKSVDPLRDTHNIIISTFGNYTNVTFEKDVNLTDTDSFPAPQITNVTIANDTFRGEPSLVAFVTVTNPTNQLYPMKLLVHTEETDGGLYGASVNRTESRTIKVGLLEEPGSTVAGEARLYVNRPRDREGALDQVEFVWQAGKSTSVYNRSYHPVRGPWADDPYQYENESVRTNGSGPLRNFESPRNLPIWTYLIGLLGVVGAALLLWRR